MFRPFHWSLFFDFSLKSRLIFEVHRSPSFSLIRFPNDDLLFVLIMPLFDIELVHTDFMIQVFGMFYRSSTIFSFIWNFSYQVVLFILSHHGVFIHRSSIGEFISTLFFNLFSSCSRLLSCSSWVFWNLNLILIYASSRLWSLHTSAKFNVLTSSIWRGWMKLQCIVKPLLVLWP